MQMKINKDRIKQEFLELTGIDSVSFCERRMADRMTEKLEALGFTVWEDDAAEKLREERRKAGFPDEPESAAGNLYACLKGTLPGTPVLLSAHLDTVQPGYGKHAEVHEDGQITSSGDTVLGADDVAGLIEILEGVRCVLEAGEPHRDIELLFSVAEEAHCRGTAVFDFERIKAKEAYVLDLSGEVGSAALQAPSIVTFEATVKGKAAHAGFAPEDGAHAIAILCEAVSQIPQGRSLAGTEMETTLNIGSIRADGPTNIVPALCTCSGEIRSCSHAHAMEMADLVRRTFEETAAKAGADCEVKSQVQFSAYRTQEDSPAVQQFQKACADLSLPGNLTRTFGGSDNNHFAVHGIEGLVLSCGMRDVHSVRESIWMDDLLKGARLVAELIF